jgi:stearoyl-CoA desaturase (delta-9 desaturase)
MSAAATAARPERASRMTRTARYANMGAVAVPFVAFLASVVLLWNSVIGWSDLAVLVVMYLFTGLGVTVGYHRLLTHRSFQTKPVISYAFAVAGSMAVEGPVINWVADHRKHHAHTDEEGDPHSPHVGHGSGLKGLWFAHVGWLWESQGRAARRKYAPDLMDDPGMRAINKAFLPLVGVSLLLPALLGLAFSGGSWKGALTGLLWGGLVRIFFLHHITWSINSVCHFFGRRRFDVDDQSTNVAWLAIPSFGESWHHNHHAFPRSARHGLRPWEIDVSAMVIGTMEKLGLAWNVTRIDKSRQEAKLAGGG